MWIACAWAPCPCPRAPHTPSGAEERVETTADAHTYTQPSSDKFGVLMQKIQRNKSPPIPRPGRKRSLRVNFYRTQKRTREKRNCFVWHFDPCFRCEMYYVGNSLAALPRNMHEAMTLGDLIAAHLGRPAPARKWMYTISLWILFNYRT